MSQNLSQYALFPTLTYAFRIQFLRFPYSLHTYSAFTECVSFLII